MTSLLFVVIAAPGVVPSVEQDRAIHLLDEFTAGKQNIVSRDGLLVSVRTTEDWVSGTVKSKYLDDTILSEADEPVWHEFSRCYLYGECTPSICRKLGKRFLAKVYGVPANQQISGWGARVQPMTWIKQGFDVWHERTISNALEVHIASNCKLYVYFVKEHGRLRIWKVEEAIH